MAHTSHPCPTLRAEDVVEEAAAEVWIEMHDKLAATRATTLAGIQFKARFSPTPCADPIMMQSIVEDLLGF